MDIGGWADLSARMVDLLRSHPHRRAHAGARPGDARELLLDLAMHKLSQAKVAELRRHLPKRNLSAFRCCPGWQIGRRHEQDVGWLDVTMNHAHGMRMTHRTCERSDQLRRLTGRQRPRMPIEPSGQIPSLAVFADDVHQAFSLPHLVHSHDVGMDQPGGQLRLPDETPAKER